MRFIAQDSTVINTEGWPHSIYGDVEDIEVGESVCVVFTVRIAVYMEGLARSAQLYACTLRQADEVMACVAERGLTDFRLLC